MQGMWLAECGHFVNVVPPVDVTGGVSGDRFKMSDYRHATILVAIGVSASAVTSITINAADAATSGNTEAIGFDYYEETTDGGDTLSVKQTATASGITSPTANDNVMYVIELDARALPADKPWVEVVIANGSNSVIASVAAILTGPRHAYEASETVLA